METTLTDKTYHQVRQMLVNGELQPGERLVTRSIAKAVGVSLAPVREALFRLASEGLVDHVPGAGAFVRKPERQDLEELYVLREALESCAVSEATRCISESQLAALQDIVDDMQAISDEIAESGAAYANKAQLDRWLDDEEAFHERIVEASRNRLLSEVVGKYWAVSSVFEAQRSDPEILTPKVTADTCVGRHELMAAMRDRDADKARDLMASQIRRGRETVMRHFGRG
jgi:DNA-binding GntR family transcriptional regulator